jgi:nitrous oxidase accessory protein NosD
MRRTVRVLDQDAISDCIPGDVLEIPAGEWALPVNGLLVDRDITVVGEPGASLYTRGEVGIRVVAPATISNLAISRGKDAPRGDGIVVQCGGVSVHGVRVALLGRGLAAEDSDSLSVRDCVFSYNGAGATLHGCRGAFVQNTEFSQSDRRGLAASSCFGLTARDCRAFDNGSAEHDCAQVFLVGCSAFVLDGFRLGRTAARSQDVCERPHVTLSKCEGGALLRVTTFNHPSSPNGYAIRALTCRGVEVANVYCQGIGYLGHAYESTLIVRACTPGLFVGNRAEPAPAFDIAAAVAECRSGGTVVVPPGEHVLPPGLTISKPLALVGSPGSRLYSRGTCGVVVESHDVTIQGVEVVAGRESSGDGITVRRSNNVKIRDVKVVGHAGCGISATESHHVWIVDCSCDRNAADGVRLERCFGARVAGTRMYGNAGRGLTAAGCDSLSLQGNLHGDNGLGWDVRGCTMARDAALDFAPEPGPPVAAKFDLAAETARCPAGGVVTVPPGEWPLPPEGLVVDKSVTIQGAPGTTLFSRGRVGIRVCAAGVRLADLRVIRGRRVPGADAVEGDGVYVEGAEVRLERVTVSGHGGGGVVVTGYGVELADCHVTMNRFGLSADHADDLRVVGGSYGRNTEHGIRSERCSGLVVRDTTVTNNGWGDDEGTSPCAQVHLAHCVGFLLDGVRFALTIDTDRPGAAAPEHLWMMECGGGAVRSGMMWNGSKGDTGVVVLSCHDVCLASIHLRNVRMFCHANETSRRIEVHGCVDDEGRAGRTSGIQAEPAQAPLRRGSVGSTPPLPGTLLWDTLSGSVYWGDGARWNALK